MSKWEIHEFTPNNDGTRVGNISVDHYAWFRREDGRYIYLSISAGSAVGISGDEAKLIVDSVVAALNLMATQESNRRTPAARWREEGQPDPHGDIYACARHETAGGQFSDDEVANGVFMQPSMDWLHIAKDRIRWLSRRLTLLEKAAKPFTDYADQNRKFPRGGQISHGSSQARKQLTMGDCYDLADALQGKEPGT